MAVYPEGNPGEYPLDPTSATGQFRLVYGDTHSTAYDPVEPGYQNYDELSDEEIEGYLLAGGDSTARAIGYYYLRLSGKAALASKSIKDYDLQVDTSKRASQLADIAAQWFARADEDDILDGSADIFEVFDTIPGEEVIPELTIPIYGRYYTTGRIN